MADSMSTGPGSSAGTVAERHAGRTRLEILDAATRVLERSEEPTMRAVATEAGIGERTIYRYFGSREALHESVAAHVSPRLGTPLRATAEDLEEDLEAYVTALFEVFEANRALVVATVTSPWCQHWLARSRPENLRALTSLLAEAHPGAGDDEVAAAAAALRTVVSGAGWVYQRESCGLPADVVTGNARWLVRRVLDHLAACDAAARPPS